MHIYIYIERERERIPKRDWELSGFLGIQVLFYSVY